MEVEISILNDSSAVRVEQYKIFTIDSASKTSNFEHIPDYWDLLLDFNYEGKRYQIPIDSLVHSVMVINNEKSSGNCNQMIYWTGCDAMRIFNHGNGCIEMNYVIINCCVESRACLVFEGNRTHPFKYKDLDDK